MAGNYCLKINKQTSLSNGKHKMLEISTTLYNNTSDTLKYWTSEDAPNFIYSVDTKKMTIDLGHGYSLGLTHLLKIAPHKTSTTNLTLKLDSTCILPVKFRVSIKIINDEGKNAWNFLVGKKYDYTEIWSKPVEWKE